MTWKVFIETQALKTTLTEYNILKIIKAKTIEASKHYFDILCDQNIF